MRKILFSIAALIVILLGANTTFAQSATEIHGRVWDVVSNDGLNTVTVNFSGITCGGQSSVTVGGGGYWSCYGIDITEDTNVVVSVSNVPEECSAVNSTSQTFNLSPGQTKTDVNFPFNCGGEFEFSFPSPNTNFGQGNFGIWQIPSSSGPREVGEGYDTEVYGYRGHIWTQAFCPTNGGQAWLTHYVKKGQEIALDEWAQSLGLASLDDYYGKGAIWYENIPRSWDCSVTTEVPPEPTGEKNCLVLQIEPDSSVFGIGLDEDGEPHDRNAIFPLGSSTNTGAYSLPAHTMGKGDIGLLYVAIGDPDPMYGSSPIREVVNDCRLVTETESLGQGGGEVVTQSVATCQETVIYSFTPERTMEVGVLFSGPLNLSTSRLTNNEVGDYSPTLEPNSGRYFAAVNEDRLFVAETENPENVVYDASGFISLPTLDGDLLAYEIMNITADGFIEGTNVVVVNYHTHEIIAEIQNAQRPRLNTVDGQVAYLQNGGIYIHDFATGNATLVTDTMSNILMSNWSSNTFATIGSESGQKVINYYDGERLHEIATGNIFGFPVVSNDGELIVWLAEVDGQIDIYSYDLAADEPFVQQETDTAEVELDVTLHCRNDIIFSTSQGEVRMVYHVLGGSPDLRSIFLRNFAFGPVGQANR